MDLDREFIERCVVLYADHEIPLIASVLGVAPIEVSRALRYARRLADIQPCELSFIVEQFGVMPDREIARFLGISSSQLDQILRRHNIRKIREDNRLTVDLCMKKVRWLIEDRLKRPIDDKLPRFINNTHFAENGLYPVLEFANLEKTKCQMAKHFTACAYLVDKAYPERFKPWQFPGAKNNKFFSGKMGKRNFLDALMWFIFEKSGIVPAALPVVLGNHSFLNTRSLQDVGLGAHWWKPLWPTKAEMLEALAKAAKVVPAGHGDQRTAQARLTLRRAGLEWDKCAVPQCPIEGEENIDIHHIVQKATRLAPGFDLNAAYNTIPLCRHHHGIADRIKIAPDRRQPETLRERLLQQLICEEMP